MSHWEEGKILANMGDESLKHNDHVVVHIEEWHILSFWGDFTTLEKRGSKLEVWHHKLSIVEELNYGSSN